MVSGSLRAFSSVALLLFATTTTTLVRPTGASTATVSTTPTTDDDDGVAEACSAELEDCRADDTCVTCFQDSSSSTPDAQTCYEEAGIDDIELSTATCDNIVDAVCCNNEVSAFECLENDAYVAYWVCVLDLSRCSEDTITCGGGTVSDSAVEDDGDDDGDDDDGNDNVDSADNASNGATRTSAGPATAGHSLTVSVFSCTFMVLLPILCA